MTRIFMLFMLFSFSILTNAQQKYFIYFADKGLPDGSRLEKSSEYYRLAKENLSERSLLRREKILGEDYAVDYYDIPVNKVYKNEIEKLGISIRRSLKWFNAVSCYLDDYQLSIVKELEFVKKVEPVRGMTIKSLQGNQLSTTIMNSPTSYSLDYGNSLLQMELSEVPAVHDLGYAGEGVILGFIDSGFNWEIHQSTSGLNVLWEYDYVFDDDDTGDDANDVSSSQNRHGTQTVAVACGYEPGVIIGPAYKADVMFAKTENIAVEQNVEEDDFAAAVEEMENRGVDIITSSLGYLIFDNDQLSYTHEDMDGQTAITTIAYERAAQLGVLTVTSAGNEGEYLPTRPYGGITAPADGLLTVAVGNVNGSNAVVWSSSQGPTADGRIKPEICALGTDVYTVGSRTDTYSWANGTSYAAPIVAGIASQILGVYPHLTNRQIRQILMESGDNAELPDNFRGWGLVSAKRALSYPNIQTVYPGYRINKIFFDPPGIINGSARIYYSVNNGEFEFASLVQEDEHKYYFDMPRLSANDSIAFYFTHMINDGIVVREPEQGNYKSYYGRLDVNLHTFEIIESEIPSDYYLSYNYPNPFNNGTRINFWIPVDDEVKLIVFNSLGEKVATLFEGGLEMGKYSASWNGRADDGSIVSSGVYFYVLYSSFREILSGKMILLK